MKKNMFKRIAATAMASILLVSSLTGCGAAEGAADSQGEVKEIKIGSIHPLTGGMAYEAMNNASKLETNFIIILNRCFSNIFFTFVADTSEMYAAKIENLLKKANGEQ